MKKCKRLEIQITLFQIDSLPERDNHEYFLFFFRRGEKGGLDINTDIKLIYAMQRNKKYKRLEIQITLFQTDSLSQDNHEYFRFLFPQKRTEKVLKY